MDSKWRPECEDTNGYMCPPCPVYFPSEMEFRNPLEFISKIRSQAEKAGICKIVPPPGWRPPFSVNEKRFRFQTRVQSLNTLEATSRMDSDFMESLRMFLYENGMPLVGIPKIHGVPINFRRLYQFVRKMGGHNNMSRRHWKEAAKLLGIDINQKGIQLSKIYEQYLLDYEGHEKSGYDGRRSYDHTSQMKIHLDNPIIFDKEQLASTLDPKTLKPNPLRTGVIDPPKIRIGQKFYQFFEPDKCLLGEIKRINSTGKGGVAIVDFDQGKRECIQISELQIILSNGYNPESARAAFYGAICQVCLRGDCDDRMLLCDSCQGGYHMFCLEPPVSGVPKGDWYCQPCLMNKSIDSKDPSYGFDDGDDHTFESLNIVEKEWIKFHLGLDSIEELNLIERERLYWNILKKANYIQDLRVLYGSDIDTGKLGSGFPKLSDISRGLSALYNRLKDKKIQESSVSNLMYTTKKAEKEFDCNIQSKRHLSDQDENKNCFYDGDSLSLNIKREFYRYARDGWNLNNLPKLKGSMLQYLEEDVKGVMVPWMYAGMCFSSFCWHAEDHNFYSISYLHFGQPKTWYGVPGEKCNELEAFMQEESPQLFDKQPDLHLQIVTMYDPLDIRKRGIPVYHAIQNPNEFIVTFPSAYHAGYNNGINCAEAVNFATADWMAWGDKALDKYRRYSKPPVFSHDALLFVLAMDSCTKTPKEGINTSKLLLPELRSMVSILRAFELTVVEYGISNVGKMGDIEVFLKHNGRSCARRTSRIKKVTPPGSRKRSNKFNGDKKIASRMVQWSGINGKNLGIQCSLCKQYCFIAAVICMNCLKRKNMYIVACHVHLKDLKCECPRESYFFLKRFDALELDDVIRRVHNRAYAKDIWYKRYRTCKSKEGYLSFSFSQLKSLLWDGEKIGIEKSLIGELKMKVNCINKWIDNLQSCIPRRKTKRNSAVDGASWIHIDELIQLQREKEAMEIIPSESSVLDDWLEKISLWQKRVLVAISENKKAIQKGKDGMFVIDTSVQDEKDLRVYNQLVDLNEELHDIQVRSPEQYMLSNEICCRKYIFDLKALVSRIQEKSTQVSCRPSVDDLEELNQRFILRTISNLDDIYERKLCLQYQIECEEAEETIRNLLGKWSTKFDLIDIRNRIQDLSVLPTTISNLMNDLERRFKLLHELEEAFSKRILASKIPVLEVELSNLTKSNKGLYFRQISNLKIENERWVQKCSRAFLKKGEIQPLSRVLKNTVMKLKNQMRDNAMQNFIPLYCICQQPYVAEVFMFQCDECRKWFHPQCLQLPLDYACELENDRVIKCTYCEINSATYSFNKRQKKQMYCICRSSDEDSKMICCDFCENWYHFECIGLTTSKALKLEFYRCISCCVRNNIDYFLIPQKKSKLSMCLPKRDSHFITKRPSQVLIKNLLKDAKSLGCIPSEEPDLLVITESIDALEAKIDELINNNMHISGEDDYSLILDCSQLLMVSRLMEIRIKEEVYSRLFLFYWKLKARFLFSKGAPLWTHILGLWQELCSNISISQLHRDSIDEFERVEATVKQGREWLNDYEILRQIPESNWDQFVVSELASQGISLASVALFSSDVMEFLRKYSVKETEP